MKRAHFGSIERLESRLFFSTANPNHVLILSVDGLRHADVADPALAPDLTNILGLQAQGVTYSKATTTSPSDSFPGTLSYLTGAGPGTTGVFYDVSYDRKLFAPGSNPATATPGGVVTYDESLDKNMALLSGGGNFDASSIDPTLLPIDKHGHVVYPHSFLKVNTIFNVAHDAGLPTAFTDKHPVYDIANGPSGNGVDDLYTPELNSNVALLDKTTSLTVNADTLLATAPFTDLSQFTLVDASTDPIANDPNLELTTNNTLLTEKYDDLHVQAVLNQINGLDSRGAAAAVPSLFAANIQAVSVAEKFTGGGISLDSGGNEVVSLPLQSAMMHTDASIGQIEGALKAQNLWNNTLFVVTAKHGQNPRVGSAQLLKDDTFNNVLSTANITVGGATGDDGSLIWLSDQKQTASAVTALTAFKTSGTIDVFLKGVKSTVPASQVIDQILSGTDLVKSGLGNTKLKANTRTPDLIVTIKPGFILVGNPAKFTYKNAEHGGFAVDDTHVAMIVAGGKVNTANDGTVVADTVHTQQIAVSALQALGLSPKKLKGAVIDKTQPLPDLTTTRSKPLTPTHVVVLIEENHDQNQIVGSANAPYINNTLIKDGLYFSNAHGTDHDSQPNYLELFSGANPGVAGINSPLQATWPNGVDDTNPAVADRENNSDNYNTTQPFSNANLGAELLAKGLTFTGYSETQPSAGFTGVQFPLAPGRRSYVEKHNPWAQFQGTGTNQLPPETNQPLTAFPTDFSKLPTVSFVVPNEVNDMHDTVSVNGLGETSSGSGVDSMGSPVNDGTTIRNGDNWLAKNIEAYRKWAIANNSLLITVWDENDFDFTRDNNIPVIVDGSPKLVQKGVDNAYINHFNTLRTIEDQFGLGHAGLSGAVNAFPTNSSGKLT